MNPVYSILESPHRWTILAGLSILAAVIGAIAMMAYGWPHTVELIWFYAGLAATLFFLARALIGWKTSVEAALNAAERTSAREK